MPDRHAILASIDTYCRAQTEKDKAAWSNLFADDVLHEDPVGMGSKRGHAAITGPFWEHIVRNDVRIWLTDQVIVCGNEAIAILACEVGPAESRRRLGPVVDHLVFDETCKISSVRGFYNLP